MGGGASSKPTPLLVSSFASCYAEITLNTSNISIKAKKHLAKVELVKYANTFDKDATKFEKQGEAVPILVDNLSSDFYPGDTVNIDFTKKMLDILAFAGIYNGFEMHLMLCPSNAAPERIVIGTKQDDHKKYNIRHDNPHELADMIKALEPEKIPTVAEMMIQQLKPKEELRPEKQELRPRRRSFSDLRSEATQSDANRPSTAGPLIGAAAAEHDAAKFLTPEKKPNRVDLMTPDFVKQELRPRRRSFSDMPSEACVVVSVLSAKNKSETTPPSANRPSTADPLTGATAAEHDMTKLFAPGKIQASADQMKLDQKPELAKQELRPRRRSFSDVPSEATQLDANRPSTAGPLLSVHQKLRPQSLGTAYSTHLSLDGDSATSVGKRSVDSCEKRPQSVDSWNAENGIGACRKKRVSSRRFSESIDSFGEESPESDDAARSNRPSSCPLGAARPRRHSWSGATAESSTLLAPIHEPKDVQ